MSTSASEEITLLAGPLVLRPLGMSYLDEVYEAAYTSRREVGRWLEWCHEDYQRHETESFLASVPESWEKDEAYSFGIFDRVTGRFLGGAGLNFFNWTYRLANLGYWVRTDATQRNVASTAARRLAWWGLRELGLRRIEIVAAVENLASQRVAEKAGAVREGVLRKRLQVRGAVVDAVLFSLVREDFE